MANVPTIIPQPWSSQMDSNYLRSNFIGNVTTMRNNVAVTIPEFYANTYVAIKQALIPSSISRYDGTTHIPTMCNNEFNNTSAWWMIMAINGYLHPLQIPAAVPIVLPNIKNAINLVRQPSNTRRVATQSI